jgi:DNA-binding XRE family transcriptional regulator
MTGKEFRRWRRSLEISQQVVADYAECNKSTICRWEKEQIKIYPDLYQKVMDFYENHKQSYAQICANKSQEQKSEMYE